MSINKADCLPLIIVTVNEKKTKWNEELGAKNNGLMAHNWSPTGGWMIGDEVHEILPGTSIEILSKPKRIANYGVCVKFKIVGNEKLFTSWWICFLYKVDLKLIE